jgi:hypothetical protein
MNVELALHNTLQQLQVNPARYRLFGIYWWPVKALPRQQGYGPEQCFLLGAYEDPMTTALVPPRSTEETLAAAFAEYGQHAAYPHSSGMVEDADGEMVYLLDEDAGGL